MGIPAGAGAGEPGEADARGGEALGDVAGDVDAQEVEGHAFRAGAAEGGEPVADLLEAGLKAAGQNLDVVALGLRRQEEPLIGHEHGAGEVVGQRHPGQGPAAGGVEQGVIRQGVQEGAVIQQGQLVGQLEGPAAQRQQLGKAEEPALGIEVPEQPRPLRGPMDAHLQAPGLHHRHQARVEGVGIQVPLGPERLRGRLQIGEVIHGLLDEVVDLLRGQAGGLGIEALAIAEPGGQALQALLGMLVGPVELEDAPGQLGTVLHQLPHLLRLEAQGLEEGIPEGLQQIVRQPQVLLRGQGLQVQVELLGQADEQGSRKGPLVPLDEVEVAGADTQGLGQLHLAQALLAAEEADLRTQTGGGLAGSGGGHGDPLTLFDKL